MPSGQLTPAGCLLQTSPLGAQVSATKKRRNRENQDHEANAESHTKRVSLGSTRQCYGCKVGLDAVNDKRPEDEKWSAPEIFRTRWGARSGCAGCGNIPICNMCWGAGWDHVKKCSARTDFGTVPKKPLRAHI
jgi:hypothetical protein